MFYCTVMGLAYKRPVTKKTRRISFGIWRYVTLAEARTQVAETKVKLAKGIEPQEEKDATKQAISVAEALAQYRLLYLRSLKTGDVIRQDL